MNVLLLPMFSPTVGKLMFIHIRNVIFLGFGKPQDTWCPTVKCTGHWVAAPYNLLNSGQMDPYTQETHISFNSPPQFQISSHRHAFPFLLCSWQQKYIWSSVHKSPVLHIHELWYIWPKSYIFYGLHLLSQGMKNHDILMTVLLKSFYDVVFMTIMNKEYDSSAIPLFNITCTVIHYAFLHILYSLKTAYLKTRTCRCWFPTRNWCCIWHMYCLFHVKHNRMSHLKIIIFIFKTFQNFFQ